MGFSTAPFVTYMVDDVARAVPELDLATTNDSATFSGPGYAGRSVRVAVGSSTKKIAAHTRTDTTPYPTSGGSQNVPNARTKYVRDRLQSTWTNIDLNTELYSQTGIAPFDDVNLDDEKNYGKINTAEVRAIVRQIRGEWVDSLAAQTAVTGAKTTQLTDDEFENAQIVIAAAREQIDILDQLEDTDADTRYIYGSPSTISTIQTFLDQADKAGDNTSLRANSVGTLLGANKGTYKAAAGFPANTLVIAEKDAVLIITDAPKESIGATESTTATDESGQIHLTSTLDHDASTGEDVVTTNTFAYVGVVNADHIRKIVFTPYVAPTA